MSLSFDIVIIGAGVIGLSVGYEFAKNGKTTLIIEKNNKTGLINSSRNTEVIHAGIYYKPDSLKKKLCIQGKNELYEFCNKYKIKHKKIGKLFLAIDNNDIHKLNSTFEVALQNDIKLKEINESKLKALEPNVIGKQALLSETSGIFDSYDFIQKLEYLFTDNEGIIAFNSSISNINEISENYFKLLLDDNDKTEINSKVVINCAGMNSLELSNNFFQTNMDIKNNFVKGSYLKIQNKTLVNHIIYPAIVPGEIVERVDCTPTIHGDIRFGPSIDKDKSLNNFEVSKNLKLKFLPSIKKYIKNFDDQNLIEDISGIRPRIIKNNNSNPDFHIEWQDKYNWLNLFGIESPGLTASIAIGKYVYSKVINKQVI